RGSVWPAAQVLTQFGSRRTIPYCIIPGGSPIEANQILGELLQVVCRLLYLKTIIVPGGAAEELAEQATFYLQGSFSMIDTFDLTDYQILVPHVRRNASPAILYEDAIKHEGARITSSGALAASSGAKTGRSPKSKRITQ